MKKTAVVILNFNGREYLERFLPSVISHSAEAEIIVADNKSTDDSISFLQDKFPQVQLIELTQNFGFAGGYNEALKLIDAEYYILLNSDVEVSPDWILPLQSVLDSELEYAAAQPKILSFHQKTHFEYAGAAGGFLDRYGYPYCRGRIFDKLEEDQGQYDSEVDLDWSSGACMIIRSKVFHDLGGFDADFFAHMEEIDLCWRMRSENLKIKFVPSSTVFHVGGGTLNTGSPFKTFLNFRNGLLLLLKNLPRTQIFQKILIRLLLDVVAAYRLLLRLDGKHFLAIAKAHLHFFIGIFKNIKKRKKTSKLTSRVFLVKDFFVLKKQKFTQYQ